MNKDQAASWIHLARCWFFTGKSSYATVALKWPHAAGQLEGSASRLVLDFEVYLAQPLSLVVVVLRLLAPFLSLQLRRLCSR